MAKQKNKSELIRDIRVERRRLEKNLAVLSSAQLTRPGAVGEWSVKDVLLHLVAWEQLFLGWYQTGLQGKIPSTLPVGMSRAAIDALNQRIYLDNCRRSLPEALEEFQRSYEQILAAVESMSETDLFTPARFAWTGKLILADYVAGNTCSHYYWANTSIRKWLKCKDMDSLAQ